MLICPNKSLKNWRELDKMVPSISNYVWHYLGGNINEEGLPEDHLDRFSTILSQNDNDYTKSYIQLIGEIKGTNEYSTNYYKLLKEDKPITPEEVFGEKLEEYEPSEEEKAVISGLSNIDALSKLKDKAIAALENKLKIQKRHLSPGTIERSEKFIKELIDLEADAAILKFIERAAVQADRIYKDYKALEEGKQLTLGQLYKWKDYLTAYDSIEEYQSELISLGKYNPKGEVEKKLSETIATKNAIKNLYDTKGKDMLASALAPYYDKIYVDFRDKVSKQYDTLSEDDKQGLTKQQYIDTQESIEADNLRDQTVNFLRSQLDVADKDVSYIYRYMDTLLDTRDPVAAGMVGMYKKAIFEARSKQITTRNKLLSALDKLEKVFGNKKNFKDLYDFMIDTDSKGVPHIIDRFGPSFYEALNKVKQQSKEKDDWSIYRKWVKTNAPIADYKSFNKAKWEYINQQAELGNITENELVELTYADDSRTGTDELLEKGIISEATSDLISEWISDNIWNYREPNVNWQSKNTKWKSLSKTLENKKDPKTIMYNIVNEVLEEINSYLPPSKRLNHGKLPAVRKSGNERAYGGESIFKIAKDNFKKNWSITEDDTSRGEQEIIQDEQGNRRYFVPTYYTGTLSDPEDYSYDLSSSLMRLYKTATDYEAKSNILPEMEAARYFITNRNIVQTDTKGNPVKKLIKFGKQEVSKTEPKGYNRLAEQVTDWFEQYMYGIESKDFKNPTFEFMGLKINIAKAIDRLNKYTALNILAINLKAATSNVVLGETLQKIEALSKQFVSMKDLNAASAFYNKNSIGMMADVGSRKPNNIVNLLLEQFNIGDAQLNMSFSDNTKLKQLAKSSSLYFLTRAGDNWMQTRMFLAMLHNKKAYDSKGVELGPLLNYYSVKDGLLHLDGKVSLEASKWSKNDQLKFSMKVMGLLSGIHQELDEDGKAAIQRMALGRMGIMFRKFIIPGFKRRYESKGYNQRMEMYTEGYYRTTGRFLTGLYKDFRAYHSLMLGEEWNKLSRYEKKNVLKTVGDIAFVLASTFIVMALTGSKDDDDKWVMNFINYQARRFTTDMLFFTPKLDETMTILQSPFAGMSVLKNILKVTSQITDPAAIYKTGPWKGHYKFEKIGWDFIPIAKAINSTVDIKSQLSFFNK